MKRLLPFLLLPILFVACQRTSARPDNVLATAKMEPLLWELLQADQFVSSFVIGRDTSLSTHTTGPQLYQSILKKYGVSDSVFKASLAYYKAHPKQFLPMLDSLSQRPDPGHLKTQTHFNPGAHPKYSARSKQTSRQRSPAIGLLVPDS